MTPEDLLIAAAIQACRKRYFRLKPLCDIASIIGKYPDLDWDSVRTRARRDRCDSILFTALLTTRLLVGCRLPDGFLCELRVNPARAALIRKLVGKLHRDFSLAQLFDRSDSTFFSRAFSWPLLLTYASYRLDNLVPKLGEILSAWRDPPPPVPGSYHE
jgi:hypothetical protein